MTLEPQILALTYDEAGNRSARGFGGPIIRHERFETTGAPPLCIFI